MIDFDMLNEISVESRDGNTIIEYFCPNIPKIGEKIHFEGKMYIVVDVIHEIFDYRDNGIKYFTRVIVEDIKNG